MKLALIIDDYLPDSTRVGAKMFHELAVELVSRGHNVTVITPSFAQNSVLKFDKIDGVNIWRFKSGQLKDTHKVKRAFNETLLSFKAWKSIRNHIGPKTFDGVIYYSPSIFWGWLVSKIKNKCHCAAYLILRDIFPQWVIDAGMLSEKSLIVRYFRFWESYSYQQANCIGLMSDRNLQLFQKNHKNYRCEVLHNWADLNPTKNKSTNYVSIRQRLKLQGKVIYFYGGNIGHAQDMANLMRLARNMQHMKHAHFLFIGQGDEVDMINKLATDWQLNNFSYLPSVSQDEFKHILGEVDVGLFSLSVRHTAHNFPGKLLGYMVESLPILGSVNPGNDLEEIINKNHAGYIHTNGQDESLLTSAENLYMDYELRKDFGRNAYQLLCDKFSVQAAAQLVEKEFRRS